MKSLTGLDTSDPNHRHGVSIVLAAGESRRMGVAKQLLPWRETTLLCHVLEGLFEVPSHEVIVVLGSRAEQIRTSLIPAFRSARGEIVLRTEVNSAFRSGMVSSIQCALRAVKEGVDFGIVLGDQPAIPPPIIRKLWEIQRKTPKSIVVPEIGGKRGHPIVFDSFYRASILALGQDETLRDVVEENRSREIRVLVDCTEVLYDIDTPEEYLEALRRWRTKDR